MKEEDRENVNILIEEILKQKPIVVSEILERLSGKLDADLDSNEIDNLETHELVNEVNDRLVKDNTLDLELGHFERAEHYIDQTISGDLYPQAIERAIDKLVSHGKGPSFAIIPRDEQMEVRRGEYFTSCTRKYVQNGLIGNYMDISVIVSSDVNDAYVVSGDLTDDKTPDQICKIELW